MTEYRPFGYKPPETKIEKFYEGFTKLLRHGGDHGKLYGVTSHSPRLALRKSGEDITDKL